MLNTNNMPFVSAITPTYGLFSHDPAKCRGYLLAEAIESFVRQDYPADRRELVILNDLSCQKIVVEDASKIGVRVINHCERAPSLGDKFNLLVNLARGDYLFPFEHDDVSLPHRMTQAVTILEELGNKGNGYFNPGSHWLLAEQPAGPEGVGLFAQGGRGVNHNASCFTKELWRKVGGYPQLFGKEAAGQDAGMDSKMREYTEPYSVTNRFNAREFALKNFPEPKETKFEYKRPAPPLAQDRPELFAYLYRWGVSPYHLSANPLAWGDYGNRAHDPGTFVVKPHWRKDYCALIANKLLRMGFDFGGL